MTQEKISFIVVHDIRITCRLNAILAYFFCKSSHCTVIISQSSQIQDWFSGTGIIHHFHVLQ